MDTGGPDPESIDRLTVNSFHVLKAFVCQEKNPLDVSAIQNRRGEGKGMNHWRRPDIYP